MKIKYAIPIIAAVMFVGTVYYYMKTAGSAPTPHPFLTDGFADQPLIQHRNLPPADILNQLKNAAREFSGGGDWQDDLTLLIIENQ